MVSARRGASRTNEIVLTGFKNQYPGAIKEQEYAEAKFDRISKRANVVHVIVQLLPEGLSPGVEQEQRVCCQTHEDL